MVMLHTALLLGAWVEVVVLDRPFIAWLGAPMLVLVLGAQALRWWCIGTLGWHWSTRVVVVPGEPLVVAGPYRWLRHPNYLAVVIEGLALPLVHTAWLTAAVFTALNLPLLTVRIRCEDQALGRRRPGSAPGAGSRVGTAGRR
jgi:methyltransferase